MFWWNKKKKNLICVTLVEDEGGNTKHVLNIDKSVTPEQYMAFVLSLSELEPAKEASNILEKNGHVNSYDKMDKYMSERYYAAIQKVFESVPLIAPTNEDLVNQNEEELIKPSRGILSGNE